MPERGGPTVQHGIFYQNSIAALYLGRMLDARPRPRSDRVLSVRVEAPDAVDDIVCHMADGAQRFIQAKAHLEARGKAWTTLWQNIDQQITAPDFTADATIHLVLGDSTTLARNTRSCAELARASISAAEWTRRLTSGQRKVLEAIKATFPASACTAARLRSLLARVEVEIMPAESLDRDFAPMWLPMPPDATRIPQLLTMLRDFVGGAARVRGVFEPGSLRERLHDEFGIDIGEPPGWGAGTYRRMIAGRATMEIPGTGISGHVSQLFCWPKAHLYDRARRTDFDEEAPPWVLGIEPDDVDLTLFPSNPNDRVVVVAGAGFGKSVLTWAIADRLAAAGRLPVVIPLPTLARLDVTIDEYLKAVNREYNVDIDWETASEQQSVVLLLDGLDEIGNDRRATVLERIKNYSLRYPGTPWLLTVRDAAALAAPLEARLVALAPLNAVAMARFIAAYRGDETEDAGSQVRRLEATPDLYRLARIPLFLALLLATAAGSPSPQTRSELIESYLDLLFRPERFKRDAAAPLDSTDLRRIAEAAAFDALEHEQLGLPSRGLERIIRERMPATNVDDVVRRLLTCGVLRRDSLASFAFPFPIVQEYLAGCYLLEWRAGEIPSRLASAAKRPWVHAIQFALEQHPNPTPLLGDLLSQQDDVFHTNLRLVARCIANGARVDVETRCRVARRLSAIWPTSHYDFRERIGTLIADGFTEPLIPEIRAQLGQRWALHVGGGAIVTTIDDPSVTHDVFQQLLEGDLEHLYHLHELQPAVDRLGDVALNLLASRARRDGTTVEDLEAIGLLIGHLDGRHISKVARTAVATDDQLPAGIRLHAYLLAPGTLDEAARPLLEEAFVNESFAARTAARRAVAGCSDRQTIAEGLLLDAERPLERRFDVLNSLYAMLVNDEERRSVLRKVAAAPHVESEFRYRALAFGARFGDEAAMKQLIAAIPVLPVDIVSAAMALFGFHRSARLVGDAVALLRQRTFTPAERVAVAGGVRTGMTSRFEMDTFWSGALHPTAPHPGRADMLALLEAWNTYDDYSAREAVKLTTEAASLGSSAAAGRIGQCIVRVLEDSSLDLGDPFLASDITHAVAALEVHHRLLPIPTLEAIIVRSSFGICSSTARMLGRHGSPEALEALLALHNATEDRPAKDWILQAVESLAGRLRVRMVQCEGQLVVQRGH